MYRCPPTVPPREVIALIAEAVTPPRIDAASKTSKAEADMRYVFPVRRRATSEGAVDDGLARRSWGDAVLQIEVG